MEQYLRAFLLDRPHTWAAWLHLSKFWFNTNYHTSTKMTPFVVLYGYHPPKLLDYIPGTTQVATMDQLLHARQDLIALLKQNLVFAQAKMKVQADQQRSNMSFGVGD